jgi:hypothetical protein
MQKSATEGLQGIGVKVGVGGKGEGVKVGERSVEVGEGIIRIGEIDGRGRAV